MTSGQWQHDFPSSFTESAIPFLVDGGTSLAGFRSKKPLGLSRKPMYAVGITG